MFDVRILGRGAYQGLHAAVKSMSVVTSELRVGAVKRRVSRSLGLLDADQTVSARGFNNMPSIKHTRFGGPWPTGCAERSFLTLKIVSNASLGRKWAWELSHTRHCCCWMRCVDGERVAKLLRGCRKCVRTLNDKP